MNIRAVGALLTTFIRVSLCENFTVSLLYPLTHIQELYFMNYSISFLMAIEHINDDSIKNNHNITLLYTMEDTNANHVNKTLSKVEKARESLKLIAKRSNENCDAFVGPGFDRCTWQAQLASAYHKPLIAYLCNDAFVSDKETYPTFARTAPPASFLYVAVIALLKRYNWKKLAVTTVIGTGDELLAKTTKSKLVNDLQAANYIVPFDENYPISWIPGKIPKAVYTTFFERLKRKARIIVIISTLTNAASYLLNADENGLSNGDYVTFIADTTSIISPSMVPSYDSRIKLGWGSNANAILTAYRAYPEKMNSTVRAMKRSFVLSSYVSDNREYYEFEQQILKARDKMWKCPNFSDWRAPEECRKNAIPPNAAYLYNSVVLYYQALLKTKNKKQNVRDGNIVMNNAKYITFKSVTGFDVSMNENLDAQFNFTVLSIQEEPWHDPPPSKTIDYLPFGSFVMGKTSDGKPIETFEPSISLTDWKNSPPPDEPKCGFKGCIKPTKAPVTDQTGIIVGAVIGILAVCGMYVGLYLYRRRLLIANLNWKIDSNEIQISDRGIEESRTSLNAMETEHAQGNQVFTRTAFYKSQLVSARILKKEKIVINRLVLTELRDMLDLSHENINAFLGLVIQSSRNMIIYQYCPKGSLQDVLANVDIKLDAMFMNSFVRDIVKGMTYLHNSSLKSHGRLKSANCLVDSRWLIKITDYGTHFLRTGLNPLHECDVNSFYASLLWTAPEFLRMNNPPSCGTQKGDIYSFGIILQEIITRSEPYAMHNLEAKDIIEQVKKRSDPPFRPSVQHYRSKQSTVGAQKSNDREIYNLMKMCLCEEPEARPNFTDIKKYVKKISTGKETNVFEHMVKMLEKYSNNLEHVVEERTKLLIEEKKKTDNLIYRMLPSFVAEQLKQNNTVEAERYDEVTIYFSDIVGFTTISGLSTPMQVVDLLNDLYTLFDAIIKSYDVYKVETIGDAYMVVSGVPLRNGHMHAVEIADMTLHLLRAVDEQFIIRHMPETKLQIRIGVNTGPCAAGVVGTAMPRYCLFGDTVNKASRLESNGEALKIHISEETKRLLDNNGSYVITPRDGKIELKNVGWVQTYWLIDKLKSSQILLKQMAKVAPTNLRANSVSPFEQPKISSLRRGSKWLTRSSVA